MHQIKSGQLPARAALQPSGLYLELRQIGPEQLHDPFMQQTIQRTPSPPTVVQILKQDLGKVALNTAPAGVIFHVGRCGSTLASQLLKHHEQVVVYAEPLPVNEILVPPHKWKRAELVGALRSLAAVFARHAGKPYVLKLSSWNTLYCDIIAEAFPTTPWALCIRDPIEVCVSLLQQRPGWLRDIGTPSHLFAGVVDPAQSCRTPEDYVARLYAEYCKASGKLDIKRGKLITYDTLPESVWVTLAPHFGFTISKQAQSAMSSAARTYAKSPIGKATTFVSDDTRKQKAATPELRQTVAAYARPEMERLVAKFSIL